MYYTISQVAEKLNLTPHTLRYYDKEGLLPFVERSESGIRKFKDTDIEWLSLIECLKNTGMPIKDIKTFIDWCAEGDTTLHQRYKMFLERKAEAQRQLEALQKTLDKIDHKCWYYKTAIEAGTEKIHSPHPSNLKANCTTLDKNI